MPPRRSKSLARSWAWPSSRTRPVPKGASFNGCSLRRPCPSNANSTSELYSTACRVSRYSWHRPRAAWTSEKSPELILKETMEYPGLSPFQARKLAFGIGIPPASIAGAVAAMTALSKAYYATDASLAEINPFILTSDGKVYALDAKITFDDNALYRHKDLTELRDLNEEDPLEVEASRYGLNYIKLDGTVGCMVNGAGLAMATMDIIKFAGGSPANFLDVGGGASAEQVENAFRILLSDKNVKAVLINIFGGILRVDTLATGVVQAAKNQNVSLPIVLRLEGTNVEEGRKILKDSGLNFIVAETMKDAAEKVVASAKK